MPSVERDDVLRNLPRKGFHKQEGSHHIYFHHMIDDKYSGVKTYISHGSGTKTISGGLLAVMKRQLKLDRPSQFVDLVNCPMSGEEFNQVLREKKLI